MRICSFLRLAWKARHVDSPTPVEGTERGSAMDAPPRSTKRPVQ
ncbi:unnamed protein product [Nyctereutes procyonoides]|uniref:(raccoon dog) hypothetical protein n=1 Tax=Nyctereutes procyonoides TaxID=34880 RepID=A0A811YEE1_NYCPR|nr:unnamed protein product [Nyctereutes procyonoides]